MTPEQQEELELYRSNNFYFIEDVLFCSAIRAPQTAQKVTELLKTHSKREIEKLYNHVHLMFITQDIAKQRQYAIELWAIWRKQLDSKFPEREIKIEIHDYKREVIIYIFELELE